jgi:hypothetical protein
MTDFDPSAALELAEREHAAITAENIRLREALRAQGYETSGIGWHARGCVAVDDWVHFEGREELFPGLRTGLGRPGGQVMTVGREEDDKAFEDWAEFWLREYTGYTGTYGPAIDRYPELAAKVRPAFDAGMERGESKRGCCLSEEEAELFGAEGK